MLHLSFIFHMHQPYYRNLLTGQTDAPWVRLHGIKDYLDMLKILERYPNIHQVFNLVPSLLEQLDDYTASRSKDRFFELSRKEVARLLPEEKEFILNNFFKINKDTVIAMHPRYYQLYFKRGAGGEFSAQDLLDLQVWFNLAWTDPLFRESDAGLRQLVSKGRFFTEGEKNYLLDEQLRILERIIPTYAKSAASGQVEITASPFYHPILPLLYNLGIAREANPKTAIGNLKFSYPEDARWQVSAAADFFKEKFGLPLAGMWPSEESVCEQILPFFMDTGINWIVADEAVLFKSLKAKKRDTRLLYQPHLLKRGEGELKIVFRDRNLSDLIGFVYHRQEPKAAVDNFISHLENISAAFSGEDILVVIAMDGENAWEYYQNDGHPFLNLLYQRLSESKGIKAVTVSEYLKTHPAKNKIKRLAAGSWIFGDFGKWVGNPHKLKAWGWLAEARLQLSTLESSLNPADLALIQKQMHIAEGSDWFWWYGEDPEGEFDRLFRMHLKNFYALIKKEAPDYLKSPLAP